MKCLKFLIFLSAAGSALAGGASTCEPLVGNFNAFLQVFESVLQSAEEFLIDSSVANPVLTPVFMAQAGCIKDQLINIAANATSRLSGVDSNAVYDALNGVIDFSSIQPLQCVLGDLSYIKNNISDVDTVVIPRLESLVVQSSASTASCFDVYGTLITYVTTTISLITQMGSIIAADTAAFGSINMADIYLGTIGQLNQCMFNMLGTGIATVLNSDPEVVNDYINGAVTSLPYPYSCVQPVIDFGKNIFGQAFNSFSSGTSLNLNIPPLPAFG